MLSYIKTEKAPVAIGAYSQAVVCDRHIYCSGQLGLEPNTGELVHGIEAQTRRALDNLKAVLEAGSSSMDNVIKTTIYLKDVNDFAIVNDIYSGYFLNKPARTTVEVSNLPKGALVEIDCVAIV